MYPEVDNLPEEIEDHDDFHAQIRQSHHKNVVANSHILDEGDKKHS